MRNTNRSRRRGRPDTRRPSPPIDFESPREQTPVPRSRRSRTPKRTTPLWVPVVVVIAIIASAGALISIMAPRTASVAREKVAQVWDATSTANAQAWASDGAAPTEPTAAPNPYYASLHGVKLRLPIAPSAITAVAFHQTSYSNTYGVKPLIEFESVTTAKELAEEAREAGHALHSTPAGTVQETDSGVWAGRAIELWRPGTAGKRFSALDCGARSGTTVYSPVDGTVMRVRHYQLYGRYDDIEIQIKPDRLPNVDVFVLHTTDPLVSQGQHVDAGLTPVSHVRDLAAVMGGIQLRSYATDGGNHTHVQYCVIPRTGATWLVGADPPGFKRH